MDAPKSVEGKPFVMFSGHHDTWHYGVMDNGGANATMLESARLLAEQRDQWQRGLRICFWSGHSHGRYSGSAWYADEYFNELARRCVAHVNVDSTGGEGATVLANCAVIDELQGVAADAIGAVTGQKHLGRRHGRAADQSFWGVGIPSMFGSLSHQPPSPVKMLAPLGLWWHTPHDTIEHIDPDFLTRDTAIILRVLWQLLISPVLPLDYTAYAASLQVALSVVKSGLDGRMDISLLEEAAAALAESAKQVVRKSSSASAEQAERLNAALLKASRLLVPLNYTSGERFHHDPALPHQPWPSLSGLRELAALPTGSDDTLFYAVHARQHATASPTHYRRRHSSFRRRFRQRWPIRRPDILNAFVSAPDEIAAMSCALSTKKMSEFWKTRSAVVASGLSVASVGPATPNSFMAKPRVLFS